MKLLAQILMVALVGIIGGVAIPFLLSPPAGQGESRKHSVIEPAYPPIEYEEAPADGLAKAAKKEPPPRQLVTPTIDAAAALRPQYVFPDGQMVSSGTAFAVQDRSGQKYLVTAAHILPGDRSRNLHSVNLRRMDGELVERAAIQLLYVGVPFGEGPRNPDGSEDLTCDLVIQRLSNASRVTPLALAATDPKRGEWVWALGGDRNRGKAQQMYICNIISIRNGGFELKMGVKFTGPGFSGGPIIDETGKVVGNVLGGDPEDCTLIGMTAGAIRKRMQGQGIALD